MGIVDALNGTAIEVWKPGYSYTNLATVTRSGGGTGLTVDIMVDTADAPTILLHDRGTGYANGDAVWIELRTLGIDDDIKKTLFGQDVLDFDLNLVAVGGSGAKVATFNVAGLLGRGGDISLLANNHALLFGGFGFETTNSVVDIRNAVLHGRDVIIRADADDHDKTAAIAGQDGASLGSLPFASTVERARATSPRLSSIATT